MCIFGKLTEYAYAQEYSQKYIRRMDWRVSKIFWVNEKRSSLIHSLSGEAADAKLTVTAECISKRTFEFFKSGREAAVVYKGTSTSLQLHI